MPVKKDKKSKSKVIVKNKNKNLISININSHNKKKVAGNNPRQKQTQHYPSIFVSTSNVPYIPTDTGSHHLYPILESLRDKIDKHLQPVVHKPIDINPVVNASPNPVEVYQTTGAFQPIKENLPKFKYNPETRSSSPFSFRSFNFNSESEDDIHSMNKINPQSKYTPDIDLRIPTIPSTQPPYQSVEEVKIKRERGRPKKNK